MNVGKQETQGNGQKGSGKSVSDDDSCHPGLDSDDILSRSRVKLGRGLRMTICLVAPSFAIGPLPVEAPVTEPVAEQARLPVGTRGEARG